MFTANKQTYYFTVTIPQRHAGSSIATIYHIKVTKAQGAKFYLEHGQKGLTCGLHL